MSLWTRIVALISLLLVAGTVITGSLSLFLLNRTLIQSVDTNLHSGMGEMLSQAQHQIADDDATSTTGFIPVEYAVEIRNEQGESLIHKVYLYSDDDVKVTFPQLTPVIFFNLIMDPTAAPSTWRCRSPAWTARCTRWR